MLAQRERRGRWAQRTFGLQGLCEVRGQAKALEMGFEDIKPLLKSLSKLPRLREVEADEDSGLVKVFRIEGELEERFVVSLTL